ncbi:MAG: M17 family peptidase N-terminal domain-containing protein, partial [Pseudomonadota bacterium]
MKFTFTDVAKADIVGFLIDQNGKLPNSAADLDEESGGLLTEALRSARFDGKVGQQAFIVLPSGASAKRALLIGAGKAKDRNARALERIGATVFKSQADSGFKSISIYAGSGEDAAQIAFGAKLAAYRFDEYRTKLKPDDKPSLTTVN